MQSWLEGRIWVGKGAQATGMTASLRILSSKADSNTCESFTRSGLKLESVHQESPRSDVFRKRATKPLLNQRQRQKHLTWAVEKKNWTVAQWSKVIFSDESKFCFSFGNQGLESGEWRGTESMLLEVQCEVSEVRDDLGCRDVCWCWSIVFYQVQSQCSRLPGDFRALYASICWQALWRFWFPYRTDMSGLFLLINCNSATFNSIFYLIQSDTTKRSVDEYLAFLNIYKKKLHFATNLTILKAVTDNEIK